MENIIAEIDKSYYPDDKEVVFQSLLNQYKKVITESLISAFALDFIINDKHGGDVDTVHNVRQIGIDSRMKYKNKDNEKAYDFRGEYSVESYHTNENFRQTKKDARRAWDEHGQMQNDVYVSGNKVIPRNNNTIDRGKQGQLDHILSAHSVHDDRGRVLAGLNGEELANDSSNLGFTNAALNRNKSDMSVEEYIDWCEKNPDKVNWNGNKGEPLSEEVKAKMREEEARARKAMDKKIETAYYTSKQFRSDTLKAAGKVGAKMGVKQVLGFVFAEIWFCIQDEMERYHVTPGLDMDLGDFINALKNGITTGIESAKSKYKELIEKFLTGTLSGIISSISTTLLNIFTTTSKNTVRIIRQSWASITEAAKVLFINPQSYLWGERLRAVAKIISTGASIVVGTFLSEMLGTSPIGKVPVVGEVISSFTGALVSGIMSCTLLYYFDNSKLVKKLVKFMDTLPSVDKNIEILNKAMADIDNYSAKLMSIDLKTFQKETALINNSVISITKAKTEDELNSILNRVVDDLGIKQSWQDTHSSFENFMNDKNSRMVFE